MRLDLANIDAIVKLNGLESVANPILCNKGCIPTSDGLLSTEIFGMTSKEREMTFAYINLYGKYLHPDAYKAFKRMNRNIDGIISGTEYFIIEDGQLLKSTEEHGHTGIKWLYDNWNKLRWEKNNSSMRNERIDLLTTNTRDELFVDKWLVLPALYRDMNLQQQEASTDEVNSYYSRLIRYCNMSMDTDQFDFVLYNLQFNIQMELIEIYDYFKRKIEKKNGAIRKSLLGKSVDYSSRRVITSPKHDYDSFDEMKIDVDTVGVPLSHVCSLFFPFILHWLRNYFDRELSSRQNRYPVKLPHWDKVKYVKLEDPLTYFNDEYLTKHVKSFIKSYGTRFEEVYLPIKNPEEVENRKIGMVCIGRYQNDDEPESKSVLFNRRLTWADLLYRAAYEVTKDKHVVVTRYPCLDYFGSFIAKIHVLSTHKTMAVNIDDYYYENYPIIDQSMSSDKVSTAFSDSLVMSNLMLGALGGDYDGDQVTIKSIFSQEANIEAEKLLQSTSNLLNIYGENQRKSSKEAIETLYQLTRRD